MLFFAFAFLSFVLAQDEPTFIEAVVGEDIIIDLQERGSTGFEWTLYDESFAFGGYISYVSDTVIDDGSGGLGASKTHRFIFHAEKAGKATLLLTLVRFGKVDVGAVPVPYEITVVEKPDSQPIKPPLAQGVPFSVQWDEPTYIKTMIGDVILIEKEADTTMFNWTLYDESFALGGYISYINESVLDAHYNSGKFGYYFFFRAVKPGKATVLLTMRRQMIMAPFEITVIEEPMISWEEPTYIEAVVGDYFVIDRERNMDMPDYNWIIYDDNWTSALSYVAEGYLNEYPNIYRFMFQAKRPGKVTVLLFMRCMGIMAPFEITVTEKLDTGVKGSSHRAERGQKK